MDVLYLPYYCHVTISIISIDSLSFRTPLLWDSKVSIECVLKILIGSNNSSMYFWPAVFQILWIWTYYYFHVLFFTYYIVWKHICNEKLCANFWFTKKNQFKRVIYLWIWLLAQVQWVVYIIEGIQWASPVMGPGTFSVFPPPWWRSSLSLAFLVSLKHHENTFVTHWINSNDCALH